MTLYRMPFCISADTGSWLNRFQTPYGTLGSLFSSAKRNRRGLIIMIDVFISLCKSNQMCERLKEKQSQSYYNRTENVSPLQSAVCSPQSARLFRSTLQHPAALAQTQITIVRIFCGLNFYGKMCNASSWFP